MTKAPPVFAREATGLVREISPWASFVAVFGLVTGGVPIVWVATMYTAPGANWPLAFFIAFLPTLAFAGLFTIVGMSMPRSGGDYVFTTRAIGPYVGFVNYWGIAAAFILSNGIYGYYAGEYWAYLLAGLGAFYQNPSVANLGVFLTTPPYSLYFTFALTIPVWLLAGARPRVAWTVVFWGGGVLTFFATVIMFAALWGIHAPSFAASYNSFMGNATAYSAVISTGGIVPPSSMMLATAAALPFAWYSYTWYNLPTSWSGEMKNVRKSMPIAIMAGIAAVAVYYIFFIVTVTQAFGQPFLDNWSSLAASGTAPVPGIGGFVPFFALLVYKNVPLYVIMFLALWAPNFFAGIALVISQTRYLFAWAFDRILPDKVASVNERTHTPLVATFLVACGATIGIALMSLLPNSGEFATLIFAISTFGFIIPAIAGVVFPFRKKEMYEAVFVGKKKLVLPLLSWLGIGSAIYLIFSTYLAHVSGSLPTDSFTITAYVTIYAVGALVLVIAYFRNRRRGLPLDLVFKEIPPE